ncbi:MAG: 4Fe-4S dicluster domain-containing protein [Hyphomicrobiales bacterium]
MASDYEHRDDDTFKRMLPEVSGNDINGLGAMGPERPRPFFWHPHDKQPFGDLQHAIIDHHRQAPEIEKTYSRDADRGPRPIRKSPEPEQRAADEWTYRVKEFAGMNEADLVGITETRPEYIYQGYDIPHPRLIMIGVAMDYDTLATAPSTIDDIAAAAEVAHKYNKAARAARKLANFVLAAGYDAKTYPGPMATALNMIPAAIEAGLGELGKHGSMINRKYGSSFRLSAVATNMPLVSDYPDEFGADEFCVNCQICAKACPPDAISSTKQLVRGEEKWYVDFDKCIPYFGETFGCGICLAVCPWSRPGVASGLIDKLARRKARKQADQED